MNFDTSIEFLKNIGPDRAKWIGEAIGVRTLGDMLQYFPLRFVDKTKVMTIGELSEEGADVQLKGKISELREVGEGPKKRLTAKFHDASGTMDLIWFKYTKWLSEQIPQNHPVYIYGRISRFGNLWSMAHPEIELPEKQTSTSSLIPVYSTSEKLSKRGLNQRFFLNSVKQILPHLPEIVPENLPVYLLKSLKLVGREIAYRTAHFPLNSEELIQADRRLKFEEAFFFQLSYALKKQQHQRSAIGHPFGKLGEYFSDFYQNHLPFELTNAQKRVLKEIRADLRRPIQMNRLLQGDVGSGKTMVALLSMLMAWDSGFQACLMAPTEILAQQHFNTIRELLAGTDLGVKLLTGSTKTRERRQLHAELQSGELPFLVGTHALLEDPVQFQNLGLAIIDEQHRFGVAQRGRLYKKNQIPPHILIMTATPIPRTLAMSFYSDLDVSVIDELPQGRKPIITAHRQEEDRDSVFSFITEQLQLGRQIYFVYPLIEESAAMDYKNLTENYEIISNYFGPEKVTMLHGKMTPQEKEASMENFALGKFRIMVATTVIEVGVNVPNASVMVIESAEKFGLSQLHQLRGRVGRGAEQSYCVLMTRDRLSANGRKRIRTMVETNDGFRISEVDMELRGPGNILGTQQSGTLDFKRLDLVQDGAVMKAAKEAVEKILANDPTLQHPENQPIREYYRKEVARRTQWSRIS